MTVQQFLDITDALSPGGPGVAVKLRWLSEIEGRVRVELYGEAPSAIPVIDTATPRDTALAAPAPYDRLYWMHHVAMADYIAGDAARYENAAALFNEAYASLGRWLKRKGV